MRNRDLRHHLPSAARERVALPPAPDQDEALLLQKAVTGRIGGADPDIQERSDELVAAVDDVVDESVIALCQVDGLEHREGHRVLDVSAGVARRSLDVLDDPVEGMVRIDLAGDYTVELLVGPGASEGGGAERRAPGVGDSCDLRAGGCAERQNRKCPHDREPIPAR